MSDYQTAGNTDSLKISEKCQKPSLVKASLREKKTVTKLSAISGLLQGRPCRIWFASQLLCRQEPPLCPGLLLCHYHYCACYSSALSQPSVVRSSPKLEIEGMGWRGWQLQGGGGQQNKGGRTARQSAPFTGRAERGQWTLRKRHPLGCSQGPWVGPVCHCSSRAPWTTRLCL